MLAEERHQRRQELSKPVLDTFFACAESCKAAPQIPVGEAAYYALSQRKYLERFLLDGRLEISNNRAERSIKPFVIDRKNFLFANTPRETRAGAIMFSLTDTSKENGLNPYAYRPRLHARPKFGVIQSPRLTAILPAAQ